MWIFAESLLVSAILLLVLAYLYWKVREHFMQYARPRRYLSSMWFIGMGFFSLFLMIFAPNFPARAATPFTVFLIVGVIGLADIMLSRGYEIVSWRCQLVLSSAAALFMVLAMANIIYCGVVLSEDNKTRQAELVAQLDQGKTELVVSPMHIYTYKYVYVADVRASPDYWTNKIVSDFYQIKSIVRSCDYPSRTWLNDLVPFTLEWSDEDCALHRIDAQALESGPAATEGQVQDQEQGQQNTDSAELTSEAHPVDGEVESDVAAGSASAAAEAETATSTVTA